MSSEIDLSRDLESIKEIYFFNLKHTRELYKDFDLKLRVLFVIMENPDGIGMKLIAARLGMKGTAKHVITKIRRILAFWQLAGYADVIYDEKMESVPFALLWYCPDTEKARQFLLSFVYFHTALQNSILENEDVETLRTADINSLAVGLRKIKKNRRMV